MIDDCKKTAWSVATLGLLVLGPLAPVRAEHADIDLRVLAPGGEISATADEEPPVGGQSKPPVLQVKAGDPLVMQFVFVNTYPHAVVKDVTVRYFIIPIAKLGQKETPALSEGTVIEGKVLMDFKPQCRVGARLQFRLPKAGNYRVRVDTLNTDSDHEHFSAIDLQAE